MRATQSIRRMNQRSTGLQSSHLSGLAEPKMVLDSAQSQAEATLPEIVVTFRDVSSPLDDILAQREEGVPEYVSLGDQIAAPHMNPTEPSQQIAGIRETAAEASLNDDDFVDSMLSVSDTITTGDGLHAAESSPEAAPSFREPAPTPLGNARTIDESLIDQLLGEITASFRGVDETQSVLQATGSQPKGERAPIDFDANDDGTLEHQRDADPFGEARSDSSDESWRVSKSTQVNSHWPVDQSSDRCEPNSSSTPPDTSKSKELSTNPIESISTPNAAAIDDATIPPPAEQRRQAAMESMSSSHLAHALQWEPIPTASGPIDVRTLAWSSVVGIYRDDDASVDSASPSNTEENASLDETVADCNVEPESDETATGEYVKVDLVDSPTSELTVIPRGTGDESKTLGHSDGLLNDLARYNQRASSTDVDRNVRPVRAETNIISSHEFEAQYAQLVDTLCERTPGLSSPILMFGAADDLPLAPRCVQQIATELASRSKTRRVLLVDGRTRSRTLSQQLVSADAPGLAEALLEEENWADYVCATATEQLDFLPAGNGLLSICQPLEDRLTQLSIDWKASYDYVLIDGGDPNDVIPRLWCSMCDATYLLVTLGETETIAAKAAVTELRAYGARLLGCVVCAQPRD